MTSKTPAVILLDVEGTTTPIDFVFKTLFPYARERVGEFLRYDGGASDIAAAYSEYQKESAQANAPAWSDPSSREQAAEYFRWLIDKDVKSPALKSLQGKIWQLGYDDGSLQGEVYPDVPGALARWKSQGKRVAIYSSGSVLAQQLLFRTTPYGDLTRLIDTHFDTSVGPKREAASYATIARDLGAAPDGILFVSDIVAELDAAKEAGMETALSVRPGMEEPAADCSHRAVRDLNEALPATL